MNFGTLTTIEHLADRLVQRWAVKWHEAFSAPDGGFHERLGHSFKPVPAAARRLLTHCRQLSIYSHAGRHSHAALRRHFDYMVSAYRLPQPGAWRYATDENGAPQDDTVDLYTLAFVIFSLSHYFRRTGDVRAKDMARDTLSLIGRAFRMPGLPGLAEALDEKLAVLPRVRRQNPHMHLLEACLFAHETWREPAYAVMADEMVALFHDYFYRPGLSGPGKDGLCEFFSDDLSPHPAQGARLEPGHYFEWIWLLKKHAALRGDGAMHDATCLSLLEWANSYGWDPVHGGIFDVLSPAGAVLADTKRIWPFTEALKANALMLDIVADRDGVKERIADMVRVFRASYIQDRGFWVEWLNRDLTPATDYMPGTTPYHVYFGIMETRDILRGRGRSVSMRALPIAAAKRTAWGISALARRVRMAMKSLPARARRAFPAAPGGTTPRDR